MNIFEEIKKERNAPINIIHGTDWWTDCDDVAALRLLLRAHKAGIINLLGIGINSVMEYSAPSVSAFCESEGLDIQIGVDKKAARDGSRCRYQKILAEYPHRILSNDDCPDAALMYRKLLAGLDGKADITDVGFPQIIMQLMQSQPDEISQMNGAELVREKVGRIWLMAGRWDVPDGKEYNLTAYPECSEAGDYICKNSPVPVTFLGWESGAGIITGSRLPEDDLLHIAFRANGCPGGRDSWDPLTVLLAIINDAEKAGYKTVRGTASVDAASGANNFAPDLNGPHAYVIKDRPDPWYAERIDALIG